MFYIYFWWPLQIPKAFCLVCFIMYAVINHKHNNNKSTIKKRTRLRREWRPQPPIDVKNVIVGNPTILSNVQISPNQCTPELQRKIKQDKWSKRHESRRNYRVTIRQLMLIVFYLIFPGTRAMKDGVYSLPESKHAIIVGEGSNDIIRQRNLVDTVVA